MFGPPIFIFAKSGCCGLMATLHSSGMIAEGTRSIADVPFRTHFVPISRVEPGGGDNLQSDFKSFSDTSMILRESGISTGIAKRDL